MPPKDKGPVRTISNASRDKENNLIFEFMTRESKNFYNIFLFHMQIYSKYSNQIFGEIADLVHDHQIINIDQFDEKFYVLYDKYYNEFILHRPIIKQNNDIIYDLIKQKLQNIVLMNDNFDDIVTEVIADIHARQLIICDDKSRDEFINEIVLRILRSIYHKNFHTLKKQLLNKEPCFTDNVRFIEQVKNDEYFFKNWRQISHKKELKKHPLFRDLTKKEGIKSDQNYISRTIYRHHGDFKIPSDIVGNILKKAYGGYQSYYAKLRKGLASNKPNFLDYYGHYILPYYARSRREKIIDGVVYYKLTVGKYVADNYISIVDNRKYICLNRHEKTDNKKYIDKIYLKSIPNGMKIPKGKNYIVDDHYIDKKSPDIIDANFMYIVKPLAIGKANLKLIEIVPLYQGTRFKINFSYAMTKTDNRPIVDKYVSVDFGMTNLLTIYDPNDRQFIIKGSEIQNINLYSNQLIDNAKSILAKANRRHKNKPKTVNEKICEELQPVLDFINGKNPNYQPIRPTNKSASNMEIRKQCDYIETNGKINIHDKRQLTSKRIQGYWIKRSDIINDYFNKIVDWFCKKYKDCKKVIVGYNPGWKNKVKMGRKNNRSFCEIPYRKLIDKLRDKLEKNNQKLIIINEAYTSKCDALALEEICRHTKYSGKRVKRGLFKSETGKLINADLNGAINIMRKYLESKEDPMEEVKGKCLFNPIVVKINRRS